MNTFEIILLTTICTAGLICVAAVCILKNFLSAINEYTASDRKIKASNYTQLNKKALSGQTVFAGDSLTEFFRVDEMFRDYTRKSGHYVYNRGIGGDTSSELRKRFSDNVLALKPENLILLIGTNDLSAGISLKEIVENVRDMLEMTRRESPKTFVILEAVYPINQEVHVSKALQAIAGSKRNNQRIMELNRLLKELAEKYNATWLDLTSRLADCKGNLKAEFTEDGLHLKTVGYIPVAEAISTLLNKNVIQ